MVEAAHTAQTDSKIELVKRVTISLPETEIKSATAKTGLAEAIKLRILCKFAESLAKLQSVVLEETSLDVTKADFLSTTNQLSLKSLWLLNQVIKTQCQFGMYLESRKIVDAVLEKLEGQDASDTTLSQE